MDEENDVEYWEIVDEHFANGDFVGAVKTLENELEKENSPRFKGLIGKTFNNRPQVVMEKINNFIDSCLENFDIEAVYLEMNGIEANYDRWYFDFFGFSEYESDPEDLDWLSEWQSGQCPDVELFGLEDVQADFEWYETNEMWDDEECENQCSLAVMLVLTKFVELIDSALKSGDLRKRIPVLVTAHEFDIIARFEP